MGRQQSTGQRDSIAATYRTDYTGSFIRLFSGGTMPASSDDAETGTYVGRISLASTATGLSFGAPASGRIDKTNGEVWSGVCLLTAGTSMQVTHARLYDANETTGASSTAKRIDFTVTQSGYGGPMTMANTVVTGGATMTIDSAYISVPAR